MQQTKEILKHLESRYKDIDYYFTIIEIIETKKETFPDISIEGCKALLEGISKFTLRHLDTAYDSRTIEKLDFQQIFKKALSKISEYSEILEEDFVLRASSLIHLIGEIRNRRGDISHGKLSPKENNSDSLFSNLVLQMTDGLTFYILNCFSKIETQQKLEFEHNPEFNEWLNGENSFGNLSYSKALFDQDIEAYKQELLSYTDFNKE